MTQSKKQGSTVLKGIQVLGGLFACIWLVLLVTVAATAHTHIVWLSLAAVGVAVMLSARWLNERVY